jgi:hypothetical protein
MPRPLWTIALEARSNMVEMCANQKRCAPWDQRYAYALPYLHAMTKLNTIDEDYGADSAKSVVLYFLANTQNWRGPVARAIKAELKEICNARA